MDKEVFAATEKYTCSASTFYGGNGIEQAVKDKVAAGWKKNGEIYMLPSAGESETFYCELLR